MEPGEGDMSPEGMYTRIESGRTEIYAETHFLQGNVHRGKGEDLEKQEFGQGVQSGTCWMDEYQQNRRMRRTRG